jgi:hypothetical protein
VDEGGDRVKAPWRGQGGRAASNGRPARSPR